jgi:hypothetical protein
MGTLDDRKTQGMTALVCVLYSAKIHCFEIAIHCEDGVEHDRAVFQETIRISKLASWHAIPSP